MLNRQVRGFSLIELMIALAILLIVAAIAIPSFLRSKIAANESAAAGMIRSIETSNTVYNSIYHQGYAGTLASLGPPSSACPAVSAACADLLDSSATGINPFSAIPTKSGYRFIYSAPSANPTATSPNTTWSVMAVPITPGSTGQSTICGDQTNIVRKDPSGVITSATAAGCPGTMSPL